MRRFFDTNVLIYAFLDVEKRMPALNALADGGVISAQVLNEFTSVAHRKRQRSWPEIEIAVSVIRQRFPEIIAVTADTHAAAIRLAHDHRFGFYDALIIASALEAGCDTLYTEDMQHGRMIGALKLVNPFLNPKSPGERE